MGLGHEVTIFAASTVHNSDQNLIEDDTPYREDVVDGVHYVLVRCKSYHGNGLSRILNMLEFARKLPSVCNQYPGPMPSWPPLCLPCPVRRASSWLGNTAAGALPRLRTFGRRVLLPMTLPAS